MSGRQAASQQAAAAAAAAAQSAPQMAPITSLIPKSIIGNVQTPAAVATTIVKNKINYVQVDALVLLKLVKHCHEMGGGAELAQGILTGMVHNQDGAGKPKRIEITNSFALPSANNLKTGSAESYDEAYEKLLTDNLKNFRHLNIDHLIVGWYQSSLFGTFISKEFVESQFMYQDEIGDSIVLVYDPFKSQNGSLLLKAYRLLPNMMELLKKKEYSVDVVKELKLNHENFMEELPVVIKNSHLVNSLLCELQETTPITQPSKHFNFLDLSTSNVLEKNIRSLIENVDELTAETNKFINYHKQLQKANHQKQQLIQKRDAENAARQARGEAPLPEEDYSKLYKMVQPTSRLEPILISSQIKNYAQQMNEFISLSFSNMFIAEALQNK